MTHPAIPDNTIQSLQFQVFHLKTFVLLQKAFVEVAEKK